MSSENELSEAIVAKGEEIRVLKAAKPPSLKEDLVPLVAQLNTLKLSFKEATGNDFGGPKLEEKKKEKAAGPDPGQLLKQQKKAERLAARTAGEQQQKPVESEEFAELYGDASLIQSNEMTEKAYRDICDLKETLVGELVWIRGRIGNTRAVGKGVFILLRQDINTIQTLMFQGEKVPKGMIKYASSLSIESIIDIRARVTKAATPVQSATMKNLELEIVQIHLISRAQELPFYVEDAGRNEDEAMAQGLPLVSADTLLNYRWIDTRTPANQAIFRIQSGVCQLFREFLISKKFIEIHTPKLIGGASEGGSNVFTLKYFDSPACLAQSPQLYKQMAAACGGFGRVFEIGPVFRAENSNTHRHLCEFTGLDFEMSIYEHYYEALTLMADLFAFIFDGITERYQQELGIISLQYPFEPIKFLRPALRITFKEGIDLLRASGIDAPYDEDISTPHEKALGKIVREKYETDFYIMDKYPKSVRPFYTMPDPEDPSLSNSYDLFIRGEEIVSGAQRIHDVTLLTKRALECGIPVSSIQSYVDAFKHGALPHAGGGIGLERVVMLYLGLKNIRKTSMFPRDPCRLSP